MQKNKFTLRAILLTIAVVGILLAWFAPFSITERYQDGKLLSRCWVRRNLDGSLVTCGRQATWDQDGQSQHDLVLYGVSFKSLDWQLRMDLAGIEIDRTMPPNPDNYGFRYVEGAEYDEYD